MNDHAIAMAQAEIAARDARIAELERGIADRDQAIADRDQTITHLRALLAQQYVATQDEATEPDGCPVQDGGAA